MTGVNPPESVAPDAADAREDALLEELEPEIDAEVCSPELEASEVPCVEELGD